MPAKGLRDNMKQKKERVIGVIPSRYKSSRLPGKPLKDIAGMPMVVHVLKRAQLSVVLDEIIVATDDQRIFDVVEPFGGTAMLTSPAHDNGIVRAHEVSEKVPCDTVVIINGDEALLNPDHIDAGVAALKKSGAPVSLLYNDYYKTNLPSDFKVVVNNKNEIMYITRSDIPSDARSPVKKMYKAYHIMTFTKKFLDLYVTLEQTPLDKIEYHEIIRVLEHGYKIQGKKVESSAISVDTADDLDYVRNVMGSDSIYKKYRV
jgi:3-deoxy-manno-octulosonate cytidylyltransferase (CMP-KDO synthetase)